MKTLRRMQTVAALCAVALGLTFGVSSCKKDEPAEPVVKKQLNDVTEGLIVTKFAWNNNRLSTVIKGANTAVYQWNNDKIIESLTRTNTNPVSTEINTLNLSGGKVSEYVTQGYTVKFTYENGVLAKSETRSQGQLIAESIFKWSTDKLQVLSDDMNYIYEFSTSQSFKGLILNPIVISDFMPMIASVHPELFGLPTNKLIKKITSYNVVEPINSNVSKELAYQFDTDGYVKNVIISTSGNTSAVSYNWVVQP